MHGIVWVDVYAGARKEKRDVAWTGYSSIDYLIFNESMRCIKSLKFNAKLIDGGCVAHLDLTLCINQNREKR